MNANGYHQINDFSIGDNVVCTVPLINELVLGVVVGFEDNVFVKVLQTNTRRVNSWHPGNLRPQQDKPIQLLTLEEQQAIRAILTRILTLKP